MIILLSDKLNTKFRHSNADHILFTCSKFYVIDQPGSLYLLDTDMANNISIGQALRKDVWSGLWASDNPQMLAVAEKARLYVMRDTEPEEPLTMQGYLCRFKVRVKTKILPHIYILSRLV